MESARRSPREREHTLRDSFVLRRECCVSQDGSSAADADAAYNAATPAATAAAAAVRPIPTAVRPAWLSTGKLSWSSAVERRCSRYSASWTGGSKYVPVAARVSTARDCC